MRLSEMYQADARLVKDGEFDLLAQCTANIEGRLFTFLDDKSFLEAILKSKNISCVICREEDVWLFENLPFGILCSEHPKVTFFEIHNRLVREEKSGKSLNKTRIGTDCVISARASIAPYGVIIGDNVTIEENVIIRENVEIGDNCIIRAGTVVGGQGFEFKRVDKHSILRVEHVGKVVIGNNVEIKELCSVHAAVFGWDCTRIEEYSKLDAHTHVAHGTKIGKRVLIGSHVNLAGNVNIEDDVYIGPGVTISNRLNIGRGSKVSIGSVVTKDVKENTVVTGNFAIDHDKFIRNLKLSVRDDIT